MINSRDLSDLLPDVLPRFMDFHAHAANAGIQLLTTSTYRDFESQRALYARGRTAPGEPCHCAGIVHAVGTCALHPLGLHVTNAREGLSWHNWKCAEDVVPLVGGKPSWSDEHLWNHIGAIGEAAGLEWAGRWKSFRELAHFQVTGGKTLQQLLAAHPRGLDV